MYIHVVYKITPGIHETTAFFQSRFAVNAIWCEPLALLLQVSMDNSIVLHLQ